MSQNESYFETQRVLFYGRTLEEYIKMFNLDLSELKGKKILDCPAGPASFIYEMVKDANLMLCLKAPTV